MRIVVLLDMNKLHTKTLLESWDVSAFYETMNHKKNCKKEKHNNSE